MRTGISFFATIVGSAVTRTVNLPFLVISNLSVDINDKALLQQFAQASDMVEIQDANGNYLGTFAPPFGKLPPGVRSPHTDAEIEELRKQADGRPLADILRDLENLA